MIVKWWWIFLKAKQEVWVMFTEVLHFETRKHICYHPKSFICSMNSLIHELRPTVNVASSNLNCSNE
jgi:hypothetical protein